MIKLKSSKPKTLRFSIDVEGSQETPNINYVIESNSMGYMFPAKIENGKVEVTIPELKGLLESGEYSSKISVVLGENYYEPWSGKVLVESPVEIKINEDFVEEDVVEKKVEVKANLQESSDIVPKKKIIKETKKTYEKKPVINLMNDLLQED